MSIKEKFDKVKKSLSKNKTKIAAGVTAAWMAGTGVFAAVTNQKYQTLQEANTKITEMQERNADEVARLREELAKANMSADASLENEVGKLEAQISKQQDAINRLEENRGNLDPASQEKLDGILAKLDEISNTDDATRSDIDKVLKEVAELGKRVDAIEVKDACKDAIEAKNLLSEISTIDNLLQEHIRDNKEISHEDVFVKLTGMEEKASALKEQGLITDKEYSEIENKLSDMLDSVFVCNVVDAQNASRKEIFSNKVCEEKGVNDNYGVTNTHLQFLINDGNTYVTVHSHSNSNDDAYEIRLYDKVQENEYKTSVSYGFNIDKSGNINNYVKNDYSNPNELSGSVAFCVDDVREAFDETKEYINSYANSKLSYDEASGTWSFDLSSYDGSYGEYCPEHSYGSLKKNENGAIVETYECDNDVEHYYSKVYDEKESAKIIGDIDKLLREASGGQASLGQINTQNSEIER